MQHINVEIIFKFLFLNFNDDKLLKSFQKKDKKN